MNKQKLEARLAALNSQQANELKKKKADRAMADLQAVREEKNRIKGILTALYRDREVSQEDLTWAASI
jgi:hypothetical protein